MASPPTLPDRLRLTISVTPEVHAAFTRLAEASNMSLGKTMGDWLADTREAADAMAALMEDARREPKRVMREMHAYALGLSDVSSELMSQMRGEKPSGLQPVPRASGAPPGGFPGTPRPVIRGVKSNTDKPGPKGRTS